MLEVECLWWEARAGSGDGVGSEITWTSILLVIAEIISRL